LVTKKNEQYLLPSTAKEIDVTISENRDTKKTIKNTVSFIHNLIQKKGELPSLYETTDSFFQNGQRHRCITKTNQPFSDTATSIFEEAEQFDETKVALTKLADKESIATCMVPPSKPHTQYTLPLEEYTDMYFEYFGHKPTLPSNWTNNIPLHLVIWQIAQGKKKFNWNTIAELPADDKREIGKNWEKLFLEAKGFMEFIIDKKDWRKKVEIFVHMAVGNVNRSFGEYHDWERSAATVESPHIHVGIRTINHSHLLEKDEQLFETLYSKRHKEIGLVHTNTNAETASAVMSSETTMKQFDRFTSDVVSSLEYMYTKEIKKALQHENLHTTVNFQKAAKTDNLNTVSLPHISMTFQDEPKFSELVSLASDFFMSVNTVWMKILEGLTQYFKFGKTTLLENYVRHNSITNDPSSFLHAITCACPPKSLSTKGIVINSKIIRFNENPAYIPAGNAGFSLHISKEINNSWKVEIVPSLTNRGPGEAKHIIFVEKK